MLFRSSVLLVLRSLCSFAVIPIRIWTMSGWRRGGWLALGLAGWLVALCSCESGAGFSGDGTVADLGFWAYPRWRITFPAVDLKTNRTTVVRFKGAPTAEMTFLLDVAHEGGPTNQVPLRLQEAIWLGLVLDVKIEREAGGVVGEARAPVGEWVLNRSPGQARLWHRSLRRLPFERTAAYQISITCPEVPAGLSRMVVTPLLEGGGNELP
jgi:hypothetical protein